MPPHYPRYTARKAATLLLAVFRGFLFYVTLVIGSVKPSAVVAGQNYQL
jgi:hypothetical protein